MASLSRKPESCTCCSTVRDYIASHLDPDATLTPADDAAEVVAGLDDVFRSEGGAGVSVEDMAAYLSGLDAGN